MRLGTWAHDDPRRIFVAGAAWWLYRTRGTTMFANERYIADAEAERRFPGGVIAPPAATKETP